MPSNDRVVERVIKEIEARVLDASWPPQSKIPSERVLAATWSVSRSTIREAIQRLAARGLLTSRHGSGVYVTDRLQSRLASPWSQLLTERPMRRAEILEFRRVFECGMARFAAQRATEAEKEKIEGIIERMRDAVEREDIEAEAVADVEFHSALASASHNAMFQHFNASVIAMLREHITLNTYDAMADQRRSRRWTLARFSQHQKIYDAIRRQQPNAACRAMQAHLDYVDRQFDTDELLVAVGKPGAHRKSGREAA